MHLSASGRSGIMAGAAIGFINPQICLRLVGIAAMGLLFSTGLQIALKQTDIQLHPSPFNTCDLFVTFPDWLPLNHWIPMVFSTVPVIVQESMAISVLDNASVADCRFRFLLYAEQFRDHCRQSGQRNAAVRNQ